MSCARERTGVIRGGTGFVLSPVAMVGNGAQGRDRVPHAVDNVFFENFPKTNKSGKMASKVTKSSAFKK
jgi:hypothetical protein